MWIVVTMIEVKIFISWCDTSRLSAAVMVLKICNHILNAGLFSSLFDSPCTALYTTVANYTHCFNSNYPKYISWFSGAQILECFGCSFLVVVSFSSTDCEKLSKTLRVVQGARLVINLVWAFRKGIPILVMPLWSDTQSPRRKFYEKQEHIVRQTIEVAKIA